MRIDVYNSINNYSKLIAEYKTIRQKVSSEDKPVQFQNNSFEIKTRRENPDIVQFIIDTNLESSSKIKKEEPKKSDVIEKYDGHLVLLRRAPILDRLDYVIEKLKRGEYVSATTMGALSILYGPEDLREVGSAYRQIKAFCTKSEFVKDYDYKTAQHPYSFFRGSIFHKTLNPFKTPKADIEKMSEFGKWWHQSVVNIKNWLLEIDKALVDTKFGKWFLDACNIGRTRIETKIEEIPKINKETQFVDAYKFISDSKLKKLTARAMTRVPVLGTVADATIEALEIRNDIKQGENFFESAAKAGIRLATSTATTAYLGAIGSKAGPIGTLGSLTLASYINDKIEQAME